MKLLIVGGVAGGASAAARARRLSEEAQIVLFERGPDVSFANCGLPYYLGGEITERHQLLVVTPMQKIHVIEPFVRNVGFVENPTDMDSRLRNLTIEEYHAEKQAYLTHQHR